MEKHMALIKWNDSFSVGVVEIDLQHQKLVALINDLNEAMLQARGKTVLTRILNELVSYTVVHFGTEEKYFEKYQYPYTMSHKKEHCAFIEKVGSFKADFQSDKVGLSLEVMSFLSEWLQNHIKGTDKKYSAFFNKNGLK